MAVPKIEKLEDLITKYLDADKKIIDTKISRLTATGENFGSEMLKVDLRLKNKKGREEDLSVVAKLIPENEFSRVIFNIQVTFKMEKEFYNTVVPTLQQFQRKEGVVDVVDFFPNCYGARNNLKEGSDVVDEDAVIILENLKVEGYENVPRNIGFDLPTAKLILKHLAQFHAVPLALKQKDPETFETKVKAYTACMHPSPQRPPIDGVMQIMYNVIRESDSCRHLVSKMQKSAEYFAKPCDEFKEPYTTLSHKDFWVNNIMIKFNNDLQPVACKFLDFQLYSYDSPAADLFFFLFSSIQMGVLKENFEHLLKYYHQQFQDTLKSLHCDLDFTYEKLLEEMSLTSKWELAHTAFMYMVIINGPKGGFPMPKNRESGSNVPIEIEQTSKDRIIWICEECDRRGYKNVARNVGFDLQTAKLILKYLAQFHAVPIALKRKDPKTFENKIKAYTLSKFPPPPRPPIERFMQLIYMIMRESDTCRHLVTKMQQSASKYRTPRNNSREPFTTLSHQDFWINNIMIKFNCDNPVACKFLDFQIYDYDSPAADLFFFLFSSVRMDVMKNNLNNLIRYYFQQFQESLKSLHCDLKFTYENLLEEISLITEWELAHTVFLYLVIINSPKGGIPLPDDVKKDFKSTEISIPESTKERIWWICEECEKRGWLNF